MKIHTHWKQREGSSDEYRKQFFATKAQEIEANKKAEAKGLKVLARHDWDVAPTAKGIAQFCQDQVTVCGLEGEIA